MDPRLYDVQAAIDASFALAQQGNEGTSGSERVVVDVTNTAATEQDELQLAIRASVETFQKEDLRKKGDFWHNFDSPVREWNKNNQPPKIECQICFDPYPANEMKFMVCGHSFCKHDCLKQFIKERKPYCPFCKKRLVLKYIDDVVEQSRKTFEEELLQRDCEDRKRSAEDADLTENYDSDADTTKNAPDLEIKTTIQVSRKRTVETTEEITVFRSNATPYQVPASIFAVTNGITAAVVNDLVDQGIFATVYAPQPEYIPRPVSFVAAPAPPIDPTSTTSAQDNDPFAIFSMLPPVQSSDSHAPPVTQSVASTTQSVPDDILDFQYNGPSYSDDDDDFDFENSVLGRLLREREMKQQRILGKTIKK